VIVTKRLFDVSCAVLGLLLLLPAFLVSAVLIKLDSEGPVFFRQERVGRGFRRFRIYKLRTMAVGAPNAGPLITVGHDPRITRVGRFLRHSKLDELPQLLNVLAGEMSIVGPRPEVPRYVEYFREDYAEVLRVRPGITDPASVRFRDEAALLGASPDPELLYRSHVLPEKLRIGKTYVREASLRTDLLVVFRTLAALLPFRDPAMDRDLERPAQ
jgi:lipopolysaccharide/colanic/teichoic acid biosynthesis glycosyltransferase